MNRTALLVSLLVLTFLGLADAWYLTQTALDGTPLTCNFGAALDGCNVVAQSIYSSLFGMPLALYGVGFYGVLFVLTALLFVQPLRRVYLSLNLLAIAGVLASIVFMLIQFFLIKALCVYCIASAIISVLVWIVTRTLWKKFAPPHLVVIS